MIDMGFIDRVTGGIDIHDVLKGGVIKGEASQVQCCPYQGQQWNLEGLDNLWECQLGFSG